ncbi:MAG TPA: hypothetical protein VEA59_02745 [Patescibacteria group bacterium]|nr:hypothetical protein [Patescibacteria group bacterium]
MKQSNLIWEAFVMYVAAADWVGIGMYLYVLVAFGFEDARTWYIFGVLLVVIELLALTEMRDLRIARRYGAHALCEIERLTSLLGKVGLIGGGIFVFVFDIHSSVVTYLGALVIFSGLYIMLSPLLVSNLFSGQWHTRTLYSG